MNGMQQQGIFGMVDSWLADLCRSQATSYDGHILERHAFGFKPEQVWAAYNKSNTKALPPDTEDVMKGKDKTAKAASQRSKTRAAYEYHINVRYDRSKVNTDTLDLQELGRIYTHLWWRAEQFAYNNNSYCRQILTTVIVGKSAMDKY